MAISATFQADFTDLLSETEKANAKLRTLKDTAASVGPALDQGTDDGAESLRELGDQAGKSNTQINTLHGSVDQFDRVLSAAGLSLGPIPGMLKELGDAASKSMSQLGALGTIGLATGVGVGAYEATRGILNFLGVAKDLDNWVANSASKLMGWGDVAAQEAAAGAETLARASQKAGHEITSMDEAIKVLNEAAFVPFSERAALAEQEVNKLTAAQLAEIDSAQRLGVSTEAITKQFHISEGALKVLGERTREHDKSQHEAAAAAKKHEDALRELNTVGRDWHATLDSVTPVYQTQIKQYLEAGVSQGALAEAYGLTAAQIKAVGKALDEEKAAAERATKAHQELAGQQVKASQEAGKLWSEYHELQVSMSGTAVDQQLAQIDRWKQETIASMKEAGTYNEETYTAIEAVAKAKTDAMAIDWDTVNASSLRTLEQAATKAEATYNYMADHSSQFSAAAIADAQRIRDETRAAVDNWGQNYIDTFDNVQAKSKATADQVAADAKKAAEEAEAALHRLGGTSTPLGGGPTGSLPNVNPVTGEGMAGTDPRVQNYLQQGYTLGEAIALAQGRGTNIGAPHGEWTAGGWRETGGRVHAPSMAAGPTVNVTQNITQPLGTPAELSRAVSEALMAQMRGSGMRVVAPGF